MAVDVGLSMDIDLFDDPVTKCFKLSEFGVHGLVQCTVQGKAAFASLTFRERPDPSNNTGQSTGRQGTPTEAQLAAKKVARRNGDSTPQIALDFQGESPSGVPSIPLEAPGAASDASLSTLAKSVSATASKKAASKGGQPKQARRLSAQQMAGKHREISVSEFFSKNRHLLGFDNPSKALLTTVKEGVDNSLDACEDAGILPDVLIEIHQVGDDRFRVVIEDNGPGIVRQQIPKIFGSLLYGSKFHVLKQSRGQQGIGISAAGMYGLLTTGKPLRIVSRTGKRRAAHLFEMVMDTRKNQPKILKEEEIEWDMDHGTRVEITLQGTHKRGRHSVEGYLKQVAIANPHARIRYLAPDAEAGMVEDHARVTHELPEEPKEIKPHPHGVELGVLLKMLQDTPARNVVSFLQSEFSRVTARVAGAMLDLAKIKPKTRPTTLKTAQVELLHKAMNEVKVMTPPTNCISPIGEELLLKAIEAEVEADFIATATRPPSVYRGNPFQIEVGLAYGGGLSGDDLVTMYRYANRVPLQYQQSACAITKSILQVDWKKYGLSQSKGALPSGPLVLIVHIASVWVPFTSESKEAVAHYPEIIKEIRLALQDAGRKLGSHIRRRRRDADEHKKRSYIQKYLPHIGIALQDILGLSDDDKDTAVDRLTDVLEETRGGKIQKPVASAAAVKE